MSMPAGLAREKTTHERCEHLLGVIACALTGKRPYQIMPWLTQDLHG